MKSGENTSKGLLACEEALQRLLDGKPVVPNHVSLNLSKLTASVVSLEAGFDRGYLKKSRKFHLPLLARIEACREGASKDFDSSNAKKIQRLECKLAVSDKELSVVRVQYEQVLTQNLQLWERVRELEVERRKAKSLQLRP